MIQKAGGAIMERVASGYGVSFIFKTRLPLRVRAVRFP